MFINEWQINLSNSSSVEKLHGALDRMRFWWSSLVVDCDGGWGVIQLLLQGLWQGQQGFPRPLYKCSWKGAQQPLFNISLGWRSAGRLWTSILMARLWRGGGCRLFRSVTRGCGELYTVSAAIAAVCVSVWIAGFILQPGRLLQALAATPSRWDHRPSHTWLAALDYEKDKLEVS